MTRPRHSELRNLVADYKLGYNKSRSAKKKILSIIFEEVGEIAEVYGLEEKTVRDLKWHELALIDEMINGADKGSAYVDESFFDWAWKYLPVEIVKHPVKGGDMMFRYDCHRKQWQFIWDYTA